MEWLIVIAAGGVLTAGYRIWVVKRDLSRRRVRGRATSGSIADALAADRSVSSGPWRLSGRVARADDVLQAPLTHRECVYYRVEANHGFAGTTTHGLNWNGVDFLLIDDTGEALVCIDGVDEEGLTVRLAQDHITSPTSDRALANRAAELDVVKPLDDGTFRRMDVFESALLIGDELEIVAETLTEGHPSARGVGEQADYRHTATRLVVPRCQIRKVRENGRPHVAVLPVE